MSDTVTPDELLARYILFSGWFRKNLTVRPDAFIPPTNLELSVTRHIHFTEEDIWRLGNQVAAQRTLPLYGRADVKTSDITSQGLDVVPDPVEPDNPDHPKHNPNHANIVNWPTGKDARKMRALEIANVARFVANPDLKARMP
jgi:hypothetical protein